MFIIVNNNYVNNYVNNVNNCYMRLDFSVLISKNQISNIISHINYLQSLPILLIEVKAPFIKNTMLNVLGLDSKLKIFGN